MKLQESILLLGQEQFWLISEIKADFGWNENFDHERKKSGGWEDGMFLAEPGVRTTRGRQSAWEEPRHFEDTSKMCSFQFESSLSIYEY